MTTKETKVPVIEALENISKEYEWEHETIIAHISDLESKITTLRNAAEIGLTYVLAAQSGLTFTKPRMSSDVEVFNDALKMGGDE